MMNHPFAWLWHHTHHPGLWERVADASQNLSDWEMARRRADAPMDAIIIGASIAGLLLWKLVLPWVRKRCATIRRR